jgi:hypothetical protein
MDCLRWARKEIGIAPFPKAKEYQKLKVGAYGQEDDSESEIDHYTTDEEKGESNQEEDQQEDEPHDQLQEEFSEQESAHEEPVSAERNWWDDYGSDSE